MVSLVNPATSSIQNTFFSQNIFSSREARITALVLVIICVLATVFLLFSQQSPVPTPPPTPQPTPPPSPKPIPVPPVVVPNPINLGQAGNKKEEDPVFEPPKVVPPVVVPQAVVAPGGAGAAKAPSPFAGAEKICGEIAENILMTPGYSAVKVVAKMDPKTKVLTQSLLDEIIKEFENRNPWGERIAAGAAIPAYLAIGGFVGQDAIKYRSLAAIRNLLLQGPSIVDDFRDKQFLGGIHHYWAGKGLQAFQYYTGTVVDLDTEIDASSPQEALETARKEIVAFGKKCGLVGCNTAEAVARALPNRKLELPQGLWAGIHDVGAGNTDRSNYGIWKRSDPSTGVPHYYINVPKFDTVLYATLLMPYQLAEIAYLVKNHKDNNGKIPKEFFDDLFASGLSTKCFNDKASTFLEFYMKWKEKIEEVPPTTEVAKQKIARGDFGLDIQREGADVVLAKAMTRQKLMDIFDSDKIPSLVVNRNYGAISYDAWKVENEDAIKVVLIEKGLWESVLYQAEEGEKHDFFKLDAKVLPTFMPEFYKFMQYM